MSALARASWLVVHVGVPVLLVLASPVILGVLVVASLLGVWSESIEHAVFASGVLVWMAGVGWGVLVNP